MSHVTTIKSSVALVLVLLLGACAPSGPPTPAPPLATSMPVIVTPSATKSPTKTPAPTATPAATPTPPGPFPMGDYKSALSAPYIDEIRFAEDGSYAAHYANSSWDYAVQGTYVVSGNQIVLTETKKGRCSGVPETLVWSFYGNTMTFRVAQDNCENAAARQTYFAGGWLKQP